MMPLQATASHHPSRSESAETMLWNFVLGMAVLMGTVSLLVMVVR